MANAPQDWRLLTAAELQRRFGTTVWQEEPLGWAFRDGRHFVVLQDQAEGEEIWWSLFRAESGEYVEFARNYGEESWNGENEDLEVRWDAEFPEEWVRDFVEGATDWLRISVSELFENFGATVEAEQPQAWRHREGEHFLVLVGEEGEEGNEDYSWSIVREGRDGYEEIAEYFYGKDEDDEGEDGELPPPPRAPEPQTRWWEDPPFDWAAEVVAADLETRGN